MGLRTAPAISLAADDFWIAVGLTAGDAEFAEDLLFLVLVIGFASLVGSAAFSPMSVWLALRLFLLVGRLANTFSRLFSAPSACSAVRVFF
jgi:hypothetical protein